MASLHVFTLRDVLMPEIVFIYEEEYSPYSISFLEKLKSAFKAETSEVFINKVNPLIKELYGNTSKIVYIVISKRTLIWIQSDQVFARQVNDINEWERITKVFLTSEKFELTYSETGKLYILKMKTM